MVRVASCQPGDVESSSSLEQVLRQQSALSPGRRASQLGPDAGPQQPQDGEGSELEPGRWHLQSDAATRLASLGSADTAESGVVAVSGLPVVCVPVLDHQGRVLGVVEVVGKLQPGGLAGGSSSENPLELSPAPVGPGSGSPMQPKPPLELTPVHGSGTGDHSASSSPAESSPHGQTNSGSGKGRPPAPPRPGLTVRAPA